MASLIKKTFLAAQVHLRKGQYEMCRQICNDLLANYDLTLLHRGVCHGVLAVIFVIDADYIERNTNATDEAKEHSKKAIRCYQQSVDNNPNDHALQTCLRIVRAWDATLYAADLVVVKNLTNENDKKKGSRKGQSRQKGSNKKNAFDLPDTASPKLRNYEFKRKPNAPEIASQAQKTRTSLPTQLSEDLEHQLRRLASPAYISRIDQEHHVNDDEGQPGGGQLETAGVPRWEDTLLYCEIPNETSELAAQEARIIEESEKKWIDAIMQLPPVKFDKWLNSIPEACIDFKLGNGMFEEALAGGQEGRIAESDDTRTEMMMQLSREDFDESIKSISKAYNQCGPYGKKDEYDCMSRGFDEAGFIAKLAEKGAWTLGRMEHDE